jgi:transcriptional regulator with XRE-family HTH domain
MTHENLREFIDRHELLQRDLAYLTGVTDRQVRSWLNGSSRIPPAVKIILKAIDDDKITIKWIVKNCLQ